VVDTGTILNWQCKLQYVLKIVGIKKSAVKLLRGCVYMKKLKKTYPTLVEHKVNCRVAQQMS